VLRELDVQDYLEPLAHAEISEVLAEINKLMRQA
jgi:hypothetical protein